MANHETQEEVVYKISKVKISVDKGHPLIKLYLPKNMFEKGENVIVVYMLPIRLLQQLGTTDKRCNKSKLRKLSQRIAKELTEIFEYSI